MLPFSSIIFKFYFSSQFTTHNSQLTTHKRRLTTHDFRLTFHFSLFTFHSSLFTLHFIPATSTSNPGLKNSIAEVITESPGLIPVSIWIFVLSLTPVVISFATAIPDS